MTKRGVNMGLKQKIEVILCSYVCVACKGRQKCQKLKLYPCRKMFYFKKEFSDFFKQRDKKLIDKIAYNDAHKEIL